jgi:hypothetical protein
MPRVEKEVLRPGDYWYIDQKSQTPKKATFTPESIRYFYEQGQLMRQAGLSIPLPVEHDLDAQPLTEAQRTVYNTTNNGGWVDSYKLKKIKDDVTGEEVEALFSELDIPDPELAKKLPHTIRWSSPFISSFTDGNGKAWNGVITHLALTTRPRIIKQQPFASIAAAMSLAGSLPSNVLSQASLTSLKEGLGLSRAGRLTRKADKPDPLPAYPLAFALFSGIGLADDLPPFKDKKKDKKPDAKGAAEPADHGDTAPPDPGNPDLPEPGLEESLVDSDGDISIYEVIQDLLEAVGVPMPPSTADNFCENLYKAVMEKVKGEAGAAPAPAMTTPTTPNNNAQPPITQETPPLYMSLSLEDAQKIADPKERSVAVTLVTLREQNKILEKHTFDEAKNRRQARLDRLLKKMSPPAQENLKKQAEGAAFSLGADGKVVDALGPVLELLEANTPDLPELLTGPALSLKEVPHPREYGGQMTEERRQAVVKEWCKNGGIREQPAQAS